MTLFLPQFSGAVHLHGVVPTVQPDWLPAVRVNRNYRQPSDRSVADSCDLMFQSNPILTFVEVCPLSFGCFYIATNLTYKLMYVI